MSGQENVKEKAPGAVGFSKAFTGRSFSDLFQDLEYTAMYFSADVGHDRRFSVVAKNHIIFNLGIAAGASEVLWKAYIFGPAHDALDMPENITQYTTLLLRLKALYEKYKTEKRINVADIVENVDNIMLELIDFSREVMKQSRCGQS